MDRDVCELDGVVPLKANPWRVGAFLSVGIAAVVAIVLAVALGGGGHGNSKEFGSFLRVMSYAIAIGFGGAWWSSRFGRKPMAQARRLRATREGLELDRTLVVARSDIASAGVMPATDHGTVVRIEPKGLFRSSIDVRVADLAAGRAVVHALGVDPTQLATTQGIAAPSMRHYQWRTWIAILGVPISIFGSVVLTLAARHAFGAAGGLAVGLPMMALMPLLIVQLFIPAKVTVGADGVLVRWLGRSTFHLLNDVERAEVIEGAGWGNLQPLVVRLVKRDGAHVDLLGGLQRRSPFASTINQYARDRASSLAERINEAIDARRGEGAEAKVSVNASILGRASRPVSEWVAELRAMAARTQTFRDGVALVGEQLWRIIEDPAAEPDHRAAAAVAMVPKLDDEGRARLRIAAEATVAPKLRVALEAAASDDEHRLVQALEELDAAKEAATRIEA